jgi:mRNA interferase RelE/StbE
MLYRVEVKSSAQREIARLPKETRRRVLLAIANLSGEPRPDRARKIAGADDTYRIRVGDYRVVYQVADRVLIVFIVRVGHRKDVYRGL